MKIIILMSAFILNLYAIDYGSLLFHGNCITCHHETKAESAPSMVEIREKYRSAFSKKEEFVAYMSEWVLEPKRETSLMQGAIKKYKLMPLLGYELEALVDITAYIYETDFTKKHEGHED